MTESTTVQSSDFKNNLAQILSDSQFNIDSALDILQQTIPNKTEGMIELINSLIIEGSQNTLPRLITQYICRNINQIYTEARYDSAYITNLLLKMPDIINNNYQTSALTLDYYFYNLSKSINNLEIPEHKLELLQKLLINRKEDYLANELYINSDSSLFSLIPGLKYPSALLYKLFKICSISSAFSSRFPSIWPDLSVFLTTQLPFKDIKTHEIPKLYELIKYYKLESQALEYVSKSWSSDRLQTERETQRNISKLYLDITILLYHLLHKDLNPKFNNEIFLGIQSRLASPYSQIRNSALLIASRIAEFVNSESPAISYSLEQFTSSSEEIQKKKSDSDDEQDSESEETYTGYYLDDLIEALQSDSPERSYKAYSQAWKVIESDLPDLELQTEKLAEVLFKIPNKFSKDDFEEMRSKALASLTFMQPRAMALVIAARLSSTEVSFSSKHLALTTLVTAAKRLSQPLQSEPILPEEQPQLSESQSIIQKRLLSKTRRFHTYKPKLRQSHSNKFQLYFQYFCSGIVNSLHTLRDSTLLAKAIYTIYELFEEICNLRVAETVSQAISCLRHVVRSFLKSPYREVKESSMVLFMRISDFLLCDSESPEELWASYEEQYPSLAEDMEEIRRGLEVTDSSLSNLSEKCSVSMLALRSVARNCL